MSDFHHIINIIGSGYVSSGIARLIEPYSTNSYPKFDTVTLTRTVEDRDYTLHKLKNIARVSEISYTPVFFVNTAGYTGKPNVDACEFNKVECFETNVLLQQKLVLDAMEVAHLHPDKRVCFINISTGCIYDGRTTNYEENCGFDETSPPNFGFYSKDASFYSQTKHIGEMVLQNIVLSSAPSNFEFVNLRIRLPFSVQDHKKDYLTKLSKLKYVDSFINSKTSLELLSLTIAAIVSNVINDCPALMTSDTAMNPVRMPYNTLNVVHSNPLTHLEAAKIINNINPDIKLPRNVGEMSLNVRRSNCILDNQALIHFLKSHMTFSMYTTQYSYDEKDAIRYSYASRG